MVDFAGLIVVGYKEGASTWALFSGLLVEGGI